MNDWREVGTNMRAIFNGAPACSVVIENNDYLNRFALSVILPGLDCPKTVFTLRLTAEPTGAFAKDGAAVLDNPNWVTRGGVPFVEWYADNQLRIDWESNE